MSTIFTILITAIVTSIFVASWSGKAKGRGDVNLKFFIASLIKEAEDLAKQLGHEDLYQYWLATKGKEYADKGAANIKNTLDYLNYR